MDDAIYTYRPLLYLTREQKFKIVEIAEELNINKNKLINLLVLYALEQDREKLMNWLKDHKNFLKER
ncbi:MAG: hypothetical protein ACP5G1_04145 [Nanopusillaceae archaeon]